MNLTQQLLMSITNFKDTFYRGYKDELKIKDEPKLRKI